MRSSAPLTPGRAAGDHIRAWSSSNLLFDRDEPRQTCRTELQTVCGNGDNFYGENVYDGRFYGKRQASPPALNNSNFTSKTFIGSAGASKVSGGQQSSDNQRSPLTGNMVTTRVHPNRNLCSSVPRKVCSTNYQRICRSVPSRACASVPRQQCGLSGDQCRSVPRQRCSSTPERLARQQCRALPQQSCPPVPQQAVDVSCYVGWIISNDLIATSSPDSGKLDWNLVPG